MIKSKSKPKLKTLEDVIKYMSKAEDASLIRNVKDEPKNWIENYSKMKRGKPEIIYIDEELFLDCFNSEYFRQDTTVETENEFSYLYCGAIEE